MLAMGILVLYIFGDVQGVEDISSIQYSHG